MRAIAMKCPNCGANLEAGETAHTVSCNYCGTKSRIQHRTRFLERKVEMPPSPPSVRRLPVAKQRHGARWLISVTALLPLLMGGGISLFVMSKTGTLDKVREGFSQAADVLVGDRMLYSGQGNALFFEVNGDGTPDLISPVRYVQNNDSYHLAAFDGQSGAKLWQSESFGNHSDASGGTTALHNGVVIQSDSRGNIAGYSASDGSRIFKVALGEKVAELCADGENLIVNAKDKSWRAIDLGSGAFTPRDGRPENCDPVPTYEEHGQVNLRYSSDQRRRRKHKVRIEGMEVRETVDLLDKPGRYVALGYKKPGTRVPMIALFHSSELEQALDDEQGPQSKRRKKTRKKKSKSKSQRFVVDWSSALPGLDPLSVSEGAPELVAVNQRCVATIYEPKKGSPHLVCFDPEGGSRLWDSALPERTTYVLRAIDIQEDRIYVGQWSQLDAFAIDTGKKIFTLGY